MNTLIGSSTGADWARIWQLPGGEEIAAMPPARRRSA
jgi:hypothetical protein